MSKNLFAYPLVTDGIITMVVPVFDKYDSGKIRISLYEYDSLSNIDELTEDVPGYFKFLNDFVGFLNSDLYWAVDFVSQNHLGGYKFSYQYLKKSLSVYLFNLSKMNTREEFEEACNQ